MNIAVLSVYGLNMFGSAASVFKNIELAYIHCALKENFSVTLKPLQIGEIMSNNKIMQFSYYY